MPQAGFEPEIPAVQRPQTHALDSQYEILHQIIRSTIESNCSYSGLAYM
jgi:hypothetical protein